MLCQPASAFLFSVSFHVTNVWWGYTFLKRLRKRQYIYTNAHMHKLTLQRKGCQLWRKVTCCIFHPREHTQAYVSRERSRFLISPPIYLHTTVTIRKRCQIPDNARADFMLSGGHGALSVCLCMCVWHQPGSYWAVEPALPPLSLLLQSSYNSSVPAVFLPVVISCCRHYQNEPFFSSFTFYTVSFFHFPSLLRRSLYVFQCMKWGEEVKQTRNTSQWKTGLDK